MGMRIGVGLVTAAWLGVWLLAFLLTHLPIQPSGSTRVPHADKLAHLAVYFVITYLGGLRLHFRPKAVSLGLLLFWAGVYVVYGALDEVTQPFTGRAADINDWVFDTAGVGLATAALWKGFVPGAIGRQLESERNVTVD